MLSVLKNKVAVVTGGSRGIGKATAHRLAKEGCDILLVAQTPGNLENASKEISETGRRIEVCATDLRTLEGCDVVLSALESTFGNVDILINCAGATKGGLFLETPDELWQDGFALKFYGAVRVTRLLWPRLKERRRRQHHRRVRANTRSRLHDRGRRQRRVRQFQQGPRGARSPRRRERQRHPPRYHDHRSNGGAVRRTCETRQHDGRRGQTSRDGAGRHPPTGPTRGCRRARVFSVLAASETSSGNGDFRGWGFNGGRVLVCPRAEHGGERVAS